jgi:hypothetical protein
MFVPTELRKDAQINAAVRTVLKELYPAVKHIRFSIDQDWTGEWAIFFRVMLSDELTDRRRLNEVTDRLMDRMMDELDLPNLGMMPHFNFRTESEQAELNDPDWAPLTA